MTMTENSHDDDDVYDASKKQSKAKDSIVKVDAHT